MSPIARETKKEHWTVDPSSSSSSSSNKQEDESSESASRTNRKKPYAELYTERHFNTHILDNEKASLVFFILGQNITNDVPLFDKIMRLTLGPLQVGVFYLNDSSPDFADQKKKFKLGSKFPQLRFYKNNLFGEDKNAKSFEIFLGTKVEPIMDEIHEGIDSDVRETSEKIFLNVAQSHALEDKKNVVFYFYSEGRVSLHIKALSALPILKNNFVFMSISGPSQNIIDIYQLKKLPTIAGLLPPSPESPDNIR